MRRQDWVRLFVLAAIWGGSFVFMRVLAPVLGAIWTAEVRVLVAGLVLVGWFRLRKFELSWARSWRPYLAIGVLNCTIPFLCFSYAAQRIPASYSAILNSLTPIFGALFAALWLNDPLTPRKVLGLALGAGGVALVARTGAGAGAGASWGPEFWGALAACLGASICYGLGGVYIKRRAADLPPRAIAGASQLLGGLALLPLALAFPPAAFTLTPVLVGSALGLALLCSAVAYILYYRLIADVGPVRALLVTLLVPIFGLLWSVLFLGETVSSPTLLGCALVLSGTALASASGRSSAVPGIGTRAT